MNVSYGSDDKIVHGGDSAVFLRYKSSISHKECVWYNFVCTENEPSMVCNVDRRLSGWMVVRRFETNVSEACKDSIAKKSMKRELQYFLISIFSHFVFFSSWSSSSSCQWSCAVAAAATLSILSCILFSSPPFRILCVIDHVRFLISSGAGT